MDSIKNIDIVITDDHPLFRKGLVRLLKDTGFTGHLYEASNGLELIETIEKAKPSPEVVLLDISMPVMDGVEATERIRQKFSDIKIIVLTMDVEEKLVLHMIEKGVNGYLIKDCEPEELEKAIVTVIEKDFYFNHDIASIARNSIINQKSQSLTLPKFTNRELEILQLICNEYTTPEIAELLNISPRTVETHRSNLIVKTGVKNLAGLIVYAIKNKLVDI